MPQLLGEYYCKVDEKGRLRLPGSLLQQLGDLEANTFVINRGYEQYLSLYPEKTWNNKTASFNQLKIYKKKDRDFLRYFYRGAQKLEIDKTDRILINKPLLNYAGIGKEVVLIAINDVIELWSKSAYDKMLEDEPKDFSIYAENILDTTNQMNDDSRIPHPSTT